MFRFVQLVDQHVLLVDSEETVFARYKQVSAHECLLIPDCYLVFAGYRWSFLAIIVFLPCYCWYLLVVILFLPGYCWLLSCSYLIIAGFCRLSCYYFAIAGDC